MLDKIIQIDDNINIIIRLNDLNGEYFMHPVINKLKDYLNEQPVHAVYNDAESILELLCYIYMKDAPVDSATIHYQYQQIDCIAKHLTLEQNNEIFNLTVDMCDAYIRRAFLDGLNVGYHLMEEFSVKDRP